MKTAVFIIGLVFICCESTERTSEDQPEGSVRSECRDRYLWIHVASAQTPRFEAVDGDEVHAIGEQLASRCGYTLSIFKMDGFTTFRASYYSCFTHNQNDEVFTFRFNVMVSDGSGRWTSRSVSEVCSGLIWTHREIICEEDYMEVNVNRESSCGGQGGEGGQVWQVGFARAQRKARSAWQLMFLQSDGQVSSLSITEAQRWGYSLTMTDQRVVLRSLYTQPNAEVMTVDGIPVEFVRVSLFFKQKLVVVMLDLSMACTVNSGSFDGDQLLWDVPESLTPLVEDRSGFENQSFSLGVESVLLDEPTAASRGLSLVQKGGLVQIRVPFGAEGGYRKSLVVNNVYKEMYVIYLLYEHVFSLLFEDGSSIDNRHRMVRVLDTPLVCRQPFSLNQTISDQKVFSVYLGNIPADVILEEVWINGKRLLISETQKPGFSVSPVIHVNGSRAYTLRLPFEDAVVHWMYMGEGVVQYSIELNFTLTIMPEKDSYYHHTSITARVFNAFPPEITAQCLDGGISFIMVRLPQSIWEVGVDHEPLTSQLVAQRGYSLHNDSHRTILEVPLFSVGYTYEEINLSNFYATFKLLLRDSKSLEVQTSMSKRCLFRTKDMTVCSADGTMTVVATPASTWPMVEPERTSLLDRTCRPKQTDESSVLFEFKVDSCGTKAMVGQWYMVYENEILNDRLLIADGPNFISRESRFKVTVRCFYPLGAVNRLSVNRIFRPVAPGFGSIKVFEGHKANEAPAYDCLPRGSENATNVLTHPSIRPGSKPGPSHFLTVTGEHDKLFSFSNLPNLNSSPEAQTNQVPQQGSSHPGHLMLQMENQNVFLSRTDGPISSSLPRHDRLPNGRIQGLHHDTPSLNYVEVRGETSGPREEYPALVLDSFSRIPDSSVVERLGSLSETRALNNGSGDGVWRSGLTWDQSTSGQNEIIEENQDLQSLSVEVSLGEPELGHAHEGEPASSLYGSSGVGMEMNKIEERPGNRPQIQYEPSQTPQLYPVVQPQDRIVNIPLLPGKNKKYLPDDTERIKSKSIVQGWAGESQESVGNKLTSTATNRVDRTPERTRHIERRDVQHRVQSFRVTPTSKFVSSGPHFHQNPFVQQANSQGSRPSQYATGLTAVSSGGNRWTSQRLPGRSGSNTREKHVSRTPSFLIRAQQQGRVKVDQSASIPLTFLSPNHQRHQKLDHLRPNWQGNQQKLAQSVAEKGGRGGQESWASRIKVRPAAGPPLRPQTRDQSRPRSSQTPDSWIRGKASSTSDHRFKPQAVRIYQTAESSPPSIRGGAGSAPRPHMGPPGSGFSDLKLHSRSGCGGVSGHHEVSFHHGLIRGKRIS